jgi:hypothetical protein
MNFDASHVLLWKDGGNVKPVILLMMSDLANVFTYRDPLNALTVHNHARPFVLHIEDELTSICYSLKMAKVLSSCSFRSCGCSHILPVLSRT